MAIALKIMLAITIGAIIANRLLLRMDQLSKTMYLTGRFMPYERIFYFNEEKMRAHLV